MISSLQDRTNTVAKFEKQVIFIQILSFSLNISVYQPSPVSLILSSESWNLGLAFLNGGFESFVFFFSILVPLAFETTVFLFNMFILYYNVDQNTRSYALTLYFLVQVQFCGHWDFSRQRCFLVGILPRSERELLT